MSHIKKSFIFLLLIASTPSLSFATTWDSADIEKFVTNYIQNNMAPPSGGKMVIRVNSIDPRVIIQPCKTALIVSIPKNKTNRNINVKISCHDSDSASWQMYLSAKIDIQIPVLVAKNEIIKGATLNEENVALTYLSQFKIRGETITEINLVIGTKAKKRISKGKAITHKNICLICKGDTVTIEAKSSSFTIKTQGIALSSGNLNEQIRVKNRYSGKVIKPKVKAINQVIINL